jgi:Spy/CpxP family protein refolding chaperone
MANYPKPAKGSRHNANTGYRSGIRAQLREDRRIQARVRQELHDKLTPEQKLAQLGDLPAKKERARLGALIAKAAPTAPVAEEKPPKGKKARKS